MKTLEKIYTSFMFAARVANVIAQNITVKWSDSLNEIAALYTMDVHADNKSAVQQHVTNSCVCMYACMHMHEHNCSSCIILITFVVPRKKLFFSRIFKYT